MTMGGRWAVRFRPDRGFTQRALQHSLSHAQQQHVRGAGGPGVVGLSSSA